MPHTTPNLAAINARDPLLGEALKALQDAINAVARNAGVDAAGTVAAPQQISSVNVTAANGFFDIQVVDNHLLSAGVPTPIEYFAEYSTDPNFTNPPAIVVPMGASRNKVIALGSQTLYWRAYSQFLGSNPSTPLAFGGSKPVAVVGGGSAPPAPQGSQGSGSAPPSYPGGGYGRGAAGGGPSRQ